MALIKFFRNIRQDLLSSGKTTRYLKYAIGEIILVVIGILIALSINNWNSNRLKELEKINYYKNIKRQLLEDVTVIQKNIDFNQRYYEQYQFAIELIEHEDRSNLDTLGKIAINLLEYSDFHQESHIYQTLVSSGEIKLIDNQNIIDGLQQLEENYIYINKIEDAHFEIIKFILPELNKMVRFNPVTIEDEESLFKFDFQNHFTISSDIMREKDEIYNRALNEIHLILSLIDQELDQNE